MTGMHLMDVRGAFDHVSSNELIRKMEKIGADSDLVKWTGLFMSEKKLCLVVDGHYCEVVEVETGPARLPGLTHTVRNLS